MIGLHSQCLLTILRITIDSTAILHELLDSSATDEKRKRMEQEGDAIAKEIESLVERQARGTVDGFAEK